jgi:hypothetical protein
MINAILDLYIFRYDHLKQNYEIVSTNSSVLEAPSVEIDESSDINSLLKNLFEKHVSLSSNYVTFKICDTEISDGKLHLVYYALTPFSSNINDNSFLLPTNKYAILFKNIQKIINIL